MAPIDYINARAEQQKQQSKKIVDSNNYNDNNNNYDCIIVEGFPYVPYLHANTNDMNSIKHVVYYILYQYYINHCDRMYHSYNNNINNTNEYDDADKIDTARINNLVIPSSSSSYTSFNIKRISGGITNELYQVSGSLLVSSLSLSTTGINNKFNDNNEDHNNNNNNNQEELKHQFVCLVRIFGAEGMINRDDENSTYVALSLQKQLAPSYYGRFNNGRIEGWIPTTTSSNNNDNITTTTKTDNSDNSTIVTNNNNNQQCYYYRILDTEELNDNIKSKHIAIALAQLHIGFIIPNDLIQLHNVNEPSTLWIQLYDWYKQATKVTYPYINNNAITKTTTNEGKVEVVVDDSNSNNTKLSPIDQDIIYSLLYNGDQCNEEENNLTTTSDNNVSLYNELQILQHDIIEPYQSPLVFCHNDLLAANIFYNEQLALALALQQQEHENQNDNNDNEVLDSSTKVIQLIDYEYGGINYACFDIANHFNEYAGGPPNHSTPNYNMIPNHIQQYHFCKHYLNEAKRIYNNQNNTNTTSTNNPHIVTLINQLSIDDIVQHVQSFMMVNHLYWGLWAINQAANEGCNEFNYLLYAQNRIKEYWICKKKQEQN